MTLQFVVDCDVLSIMAQSAGLRAWKAVKALPILVTDVVAAEISNGDPQRARDRLDFLSAISATTVAFAANSPEATRLAQILSRWPTVGAANLGERTVVALTSMSPERRAVLLDYEAVFLAVEELRERVLSAHGFLDALVAQGNLQPPMAKAVSDELLRQQQHRAKPTWWAHG